jgi:hypothetical protein
MHQCAAVKLEAISAAVELRGVSPDVAEERAAQLAVAPLRVEAIEGTLGAVVGAADCFAL